MVDKRKEGRTQERTPEEEINLANRHSRDERQRRGV